SAPCERAGRHALVIIRISRDSWRSQASSPNDSDRPGLYQISWLDLDALSEDRPGRDPAIDPAPIVADLEPLSLDRLDKGQVLAAVHLAQHNVPLAQRRWFHRLDRAELPRLDFARHRVASRTERDGLAASELLDVGRCPAHDRPYLRNRLRRGSRTRPAQ